MNNVSDDARERLRLAALRFSDWLERSGTSVVFAESCTAGLVSASLASVPGISSRLCGSAVTYQEPTKVQWLEVSPRLLHDHSAVSEPVTVAMAQGVLAKTLQADLAIAVTGHLGPAAPVPLDGVVFIAAFHRRQPAFRDCQRQRLQATARVDRQFEAAARVLEVSLEMTTKCRG